MTDIPFTERAESILQRARAEAAAMGHSYVGTEHILLGLVEDDVGLGAGVLASLGVSKEKVRTAIEFITGRTGVAPLHPIVRAILADEQIMAQVRQAMQDEAEGKGVPFSELKRKRVD